MAQVPVHHYHRVHGKSQFFNFPRIWRTGTQLLRLWWKLVVKAEHKPAGGRMAMARRRRPASRPQDR